MKNIFLQEALKWTLFFVEQTTNVITSIEHLPEVVLAKITLDIGDSTTTELTVLYFFAL